jgi:deoxyribodipyrimidine photo-lyase
LWHFPQVETKAFLEKFRNLKWENNESYFKAWKQGLTGYPFVDAGMRQLAKTGWMHNRVRMVVASFLTKDLLIDWKWGEKYFMETLLDGDLAPNNGGWQWAASTGCDPQPYFRIFNPYLQSKKFDPDGSYIREFVPELKGLSAKDIHEPRLNRPTNYPAPIVDHSVQREKALKMYGAKP